MPQIPDIVKKLNKRAIGSIRNNLFI